MVENLSSYFLFHWVAGFLQAFVSTRNKVTNTGNVDVQPLIRLNDADSLFTTTTHDNRKLLFTGEHFSSSFTLMQRWLVNLKVCDPLLR